MRLDQVLDFVHFLSHRLEVFGKTHNPSRFLLKVHDQGAPLRIASLTFLIKTLHLLPSGCPLHVDILDKVCDHLQW